MIFPKLNSPRLTESTVSAFGGIDKTPVCPENCFSNTKNTSSSLFPLLSTREKRLKLADLESMPSALHTVNGITYTMDSCLYYNGILQYEGLSSTEKKQIVSMGSKILIFPDGYYINTVSVDENGICIDRGELTYSHSYSNTTIYLTPCNADYSLPVISENAPVSPEDGTVWLDTSSVPYVLKVFSVNPAQWNEIELTHICVSADNIHENFYAGASVLISGAADELNGTSVIHSVIDNCIVISGKLTDKTEITLEGNSTFVIKQLLPKMDHICEHQNRLFGCRYGKNNNGEFVNEIYASKLGDPKCWYEFTGLSTDSYAASCGSEGKWTGIVSHMGYVVFFKENRIHRLFGTKPANYTLYEDAFAGVKNSCENSLCLLNGTLYYHAENGIYSYAGSTPVLLSRPLGTDYFSNAVSAVCKNRYYICMTDSSNTRQLYSYDIEKGLWNREDNSDYIHLSSIDGNILAVKHTENGYELELILSSDVPSVCRDIYSENITLEEDFEWFAESSEIGLSFDECKYLTKLKLRLEADRGSVVRVFFQYDSNGVWEECGSVTSTKLSSHILHFLPPRCDHLKLRITGKGGCRIYSLTKTFEKAGEVM